MATTTSCASTRLRSKWRFARVAPAARAPVCRASGVRFPHRVPSSTWRRSGCGPACPGSHPGVRGFESLRRCHFGVECSAVKTCPKCWKTKPNADFNAHRSRRDGLQPECRNCQSDRGKKLYKSSQRRRRGMRRRNLAARRRARQWADEYLSKHPCVDCGEADVIVLEFDHVTGTKRDHVSTLVLMGASIGSIQSEVAKCEVRCANCHRRVTHARRLRSRPDVKPVREEQPAETIAMPLFD